MTVICLCLLLAVSAFLPRRAYASDKDEGTSLSQLKDARIGVQTGTSFDEMVKEKMPDAQVVYFNTKADLVAALTGRKIDAFAVDEPVAQILSREYSEVAWLPEFLDTYSFAPVFPKTPKGEALRSQFDDFLQQLPDDTLDMLASKWFGEDESAKTMPDITHLPAGNGTLRLATEAGYAPFEYVRDGEIVGYDIELSALFCEACGYGMEIVDMNFDGILPSVQTGKCDFAAAGINITPERMESVLFSEPTFSGGTVLVVLKENAFTGDSGKDSLWGDIASSFNKTFIRENRWRLFVQGVGTTLLITVLSILLGTALGFCAFMLCRNGSPAANTIARFCVWLVQGMPVVVLLMILFYIVFGRVDISGIAVAVIGFTLTFGASVFSLMKMGVGAGPFQPQHIFPDHPAPGHPAHPSRLSGGDRRTDQGDRCRRLHSCERSDQNRRYCAQQDLRGFLPADRRHGHLFCSGGIAEHAGGLAACSERSEKTIESAHFEGGQDR